MNNKSTNVRGINTPQLLFYNLSNPKPTPSGFVNLKNLQPMNSKVAYSKVAYMQPYYS